jgi:DNA replication protein DnaC
MNEHDKQHLQTAKAQLELIRRQQGIGTPASLPTPRQALERVRTVAQTLYVQTSQGGAAPPPSPVCPVCHNFRFVRRDLPPAHPDFGKSVPCPSCHDQWIEANRAREMAPRWQLSAQEQATARKPFGRRRDYPIVEEAARRLSTFVANAIAGTPTHHYFTLDGTPGTGKSHLCLRAAFKASEVPVSVIYITGTALSEKLKDFGYKDWDTSRRDADTRRGLAISDLTTARLVVLDEIDHITGDWTNDYLLEILNRRRRNNLATLLAGNNLSLLGRESDRHLSVTPVLSRLKGREGIWMDFSAVPDARGLTFATPKETAS